MQRGRPGGAHARGTGTGDAPGLGERAGLCRQCADRGWGRGEIGVWMAGWWWWGGEEGGKVVGEGEGGLL